VPDKIEDSGGRRRWLRPAVWTLAVLLVAFAAFGAFEMINGPAAISYSDFLDQLDGGNVASVTFQGTQIDGHFKQPIGALHSNAVAPQEIFRSRVPDFGDPALLPELRKQHVAIDVVSSSSWTRLLAGLPWPMLLLMGAALIAGLVRLARGGSASGTADSTHPMQGMLGLISGFFSKGQEGTTAQRDGHDAP
jgi:ATP-dependent Zn protease